MPAAKPDGGSCEGGRWSAGVVLGGRVEDLDPRVVERRVFGVELRPECPRPPRPTGRRRAGRRCRSGTAGFRSARSGSPPAIFWLAGSVEPDGIGCRDDRDVVDLAESGQPGRRPRRVVRVRYLSLQRVRCEGLALAAPGEELKVRQGEQRGEQRCVGARSAETSSQIRLRSSVGRSACSTFEMARGCASLSSSPV